MLLISIIINLDLRLFQKVAFMLNTNFIKLKYFLQNASKKLSSQKFLEEFVHIYKSAWLSHQNITLNAFLANY